MKNCVVFQLMVGFFQRKNREKYLANRSLDEVFSYNIGAPDDDLTREAFRMLKEMRRKDETKRNSTEEDDRKEEPEDLS